MAEVKVTFDDGEAYERFMGRWSRAAGEIFLTWIAPPKDVSWLDIGCGTGAFSQLILARTSPRAVTGVDPAPAQIDYAGRQSMCANFRVADALALPFADGEFDVVVSALVIHFLPDRAKGFAEMLRVARPGGMVAGYTWYRTPTSDHAPYAPMYEALQRIGGDPLRSPVVPEATPDGLRAALDNAGFTGIEIDMIEAKQTFADFDDYWTSQTPPFAPTGRTVATLTQDKRDELRRVLRSTLPAADGRITYPVRAVAFKAKKPA